MAQLDGGEFANMSSTVSVSIAQTEAQRVACFALRYRVYAEELGCPLSDADPGLKLDRTPEDATALHFGAWDGAELAATMRVFHGQDGFPQSLIDSCRAQLSLDNIKAWLADRQGGLSLLDGIQASRDIARFLSAKPLPQLAVVSRLAIDSRYRGGTVIVALFRESFRLLLEQYPETSLLFILSLDTPRLVALYKMLGF